MRVLTWNIRAGGGSRLPRIAAALEAHQADVLVLTEYRTGAAGQELRAILTGLGHTWISPIEPPPGRNGVLIATRTKPRGLAVVTEAVAEPWRMLTLMLDGVRLFGIYMPNLKLKIPYWDSLIEAARPHAHKTTLALGDFNTCRAFVDEPGAIDSTAHYMDKIIDAGLADIWRDRFPEGREFSWYSHRGNGFRIDHAFASRRLARRIGTIGYSHRERIDGLSDHSALVIDIAPQTAIA